MGGSDTILSIPAANESTKALEPHYPAKGLPTGQRHGCVNSAVAGRHKAL